MYTLLKQLIGKSLRSGEWRSLLKEVKQKPQKDSFRQYIWLSFKQHGIAVLYDSEKKAIQQIDVYAEGVEGFSQYTGDLMGALHLNSDRIELFKRLGKPAFSTKIRPSLDRSLYDDWHAYLAAIERLPVSVFTYFFADIPLKFSVSFDWGQSKEIRTASLGFYELADEARELKASFEFAKAARIYEQLRRDNPLYCEDLAECYANLEKIGKAKKMYLLAIKYNKFGEKEFGHIRANYARYLQGIGDEREAFDQYVIYYRQQRKSNRINLPKVRQWLEWLADRLEISEIELRDLDLWSDFSGDSDPVSKPNPIVCIEKIIARHDPEQLIRIGAPVDEYRGEAIKLSALINENHSLQDIEKAVAHVFHNSFDMIYKVKRDAESGEIEKRLAYENEPTAERQEQERAIALEIFEALRKTK